MELSFSSKKMEKILQNERRLKQFYANDYKKIGNRLTELKLADNLACISNIPPPRRHKLTGERSECWGIDYSKNDRIVIKPIGDFDAEDLSTIVNIKILALEDYH